MKTIDYITTETRKVKWIYDEFKSSNLFVDNSFQREYVWLPKHQIKLIETILLGYSIPEIYLWETETDPDSGNTKYSIVDGQQRIGALKNFIAGDFELNPDFLENKESSYSTKKFKDLSPDEKRAIWEYPFSIRFVKREVLRTDIVSMFLRLNRTNMTLNPQELRNAEFEGLFLKLAEEIAQEEFWSSYKIFPPQKIRRMKDIEFISQILIFLRKGISGETNQEALNQAYDKYNEEYDDYEKDKETILKMLNLLEKIIQPIPNKVSFIRRTTHLYTFLILLYFLIEKNSLQGRSIHTSTGEHDKFFDNFITEARIFIENYDNPEDLKSIYSTRKFSLINQYKKSVTEGTQSKSKRIDRIKLLQELFDL